MRPLIVLAILSITMCQAQDLNPGKLRQELKKPSATLPDQIRQWFGKELSTGANAKTAACDVAWAVEAPGAKAVVVKSLDNRQFPLTQIGKSGVFAAAEAFPNNTGFRWQFEVDGKPFGPVRDLEVYEPDPYSKVDPTVPQGKLTQMPRWKSTIYEGTERDWWIYVPAQYKAEKPACLMIFQDGQWAKDYAPTVFNNLIAKEEIPVTIAVFVSPGAFADGKSNRSTEYDTLSDKYSRYLLEEIIPEVRKVANLREGPDNWAITGLSSGGICAFTAAWERPDKFGKVLSWIGSFANIAGGQSGIAGGHNYPALIRRNDKKPIRVFLQDGTNDLDNQFGNWYLCNLSMASALKFKGYDYRIETSGGFHSDKHGRAIFGETLKWLWRDIK